MSCTECNTCQKFHATSLISKKCQCGHEKKSHVGKQSSTLPVPETAGAKDRSQSLATPREAKKSASLPGPIAPLAAATTPASATAKAAEAPPVPSKPKVVCVHSPGLY